MKHPLVGIEMLISGRDMVDNISNPQLEDLTHLESLIQDGRKLIESLVGLKPG